MAEQQTESELLCARAYGYLPGRPGLRATARGWGRTPLEAADAAEEAFWKKFGDGAVYEDWGAA